MKLYHVTTPRKAKKYKETGCILAPVRGFNNLTAAMAWAIKANRTVILEFDADKPYKLPDHHNKWGEAWWNDGDVREYKCVYSAEDVMKSKDSMKEAPEKIYFSTNENGTNYTERIPFGRKYVEYVRKDAFIEKVEKYLEEHFINEVSVLAGGPVNIKFDQAFEKFIKYIKGE